MLQKLREMDEQRAEPSRATQDLEFVVQARVNGWYKKYYKPVETSVSSKKQTGQRTRRPWLSTFMLLFPPLLAAVAVGVATLIDAFRG